MTERLANRLSLFGCWQLLHGRHIVEVPARSRRLMAFLALRGRRSRAFVAGALWPDVDEHRAQASLRAALSFLHRHAPELVLTTPSELWLAEHVSVDVHTFRLNANRVLTSQTLPDLSHPSRWSIIVGGDLLPGWYDDWVRLERDRIHHTRLHVLETLACRLAEAESFAQALECALTAVEIDPLRESARRSLIQVHLAEGNTVEAVREYRRFSSILDAELGIKPTSQLTSMLGTTLSQLV
ncbi:AfsR/SARP family transcriptional regulator [Phytoactinopolyspora mesophila]|nr:BTAD domain-containing putative transcriptional regulator [Phytoactinopolyspora mesophila]